MDELAAVLERAMEKRAGNAAVTVANVADQKVKDVLSSFNDPTISKVLATQSTLDRKGEQSTAAPEPEHRERYTPIRLHAKGGIGQVWLVRDQVLGREVALKCLAKPGDPKAEAPPNGQVSSVSGRIGNSFTKLPFFWNTWMRSLVRSQT